MSLSTRILLPFALGALGLSACGGAALGDAATPEQDSLASELEQRASDLDAELARLEQERDRNAEAPGAGGVNGEGPAGQPPPPPPSPAESVAQAAPSADEEPTEPARPSKRERCKTACRALESMQRSSERICSLVGASHEKCSWARSQVDDARGRVERAGCSCVK